MYGRLLDGNGTRLHAPPFITSRWAASIALLTIACGGPDNLPPPPLYIEPVASSTELPASLSPSLVLLEDGTACVTETYWYRIICTDSVGQPLVFGARGEGPGEFLFPELVLRAPDGMIGVLDTDLHRLSLFTRAGGFESATSSFPPGFRGYERKVVGETLVGSYRDQSRNLVTAEIELATGRVLWDRTFPTENEVVDCSTQSTRSRQLSSGYSGSGRSLLFVACHGEFLVWYLDRNDAKPTAIVRSTYVERYPTDRDVAALLRTMSEFRMSDEEVRARPKVWYGPRVVDDAQRFWGVSHWEAVEDVTPPMSYIDLFTLASDGPRYVLTLELKDKVIGMDVLNDTLAVLVERDIGNGQTRRSVDWYDIAEIDLGLDLPR